MLTRVDENVIAVPEDAISTLAGVSTVYVIEDGKARQQQVTLGARQDKLVEIASGLKGDEMLATTQPEPARDRRQRAGRQRRRRGRGRRRWRERPAGAAAAGRSASMKIAEVSVKRPVFAIMMTAALIVLGAVSYEIARPRPDAEDRRGRSSTSRSNLPGASAEEIETQITKRIEEAVNTISGIDELRASSDQGNVARHHHLHARARHRVGDPGRPRQAGARSSTSSRATPGRCRSRRWIPTRSRSSASPCIGPRSQKEITEIADKRVKQELETVEGRRLGRLQRRAQARDPAAAQRRPAQRLRPDGRAGAHRGRSGRTSRFPAAQFTAGPAEVALRTMGRIKNVEDFNRIVIAYRADGSVITFADIGRVQDSVQEVRERDTAERHARDRRPGPQAVGHQHRRGGRPRAGQAATRSRRQLPQDIQISIGNDQSRFIRRSFEDIKLHLILGGLLASVVVFLFIRNLRVTFIAALADPDLDHRHLHVHEDGRLHAEQHDDAGAVARHRHRHRRRDRRAREHLPVRRREGRHAEGGGRRGDAGNRPGGHGDDLSLVVIFVPVAFMTGQIGRYFYSFGITSAAAILISMFVSFTLTPALCAMWLKKEDVKSDHSTTKSGGFYAKMDAVYGRMLAVVAAPPRR